MDLPSLVPIQGLCSVRVEAYDWSSEVPESLGAVPFDVILGTDVAYYEHLYAPFVQASAATVRAAQAVVFLVPSPAPANRYARNSRYPKQPFDAAEG